MSIRLSRRGFLEAAAVTGGALATGTWGCASRAWSQAQGLSNGTVAQGHVNVHEQILDLAAEMQKQRRARFAAVKTPAELAALQKDLREKFLALLDGFPEAKGPPPATKTGQIDADDYTVDKLVYESFPGYFVSALLYMPKKRDGAIPGVIVPCGHSANGKGGYQVIHMNLAKRGYAVLAYDPVGQAERSQFWDEARGRSKYNLMCGEHAVLGNPMYLLGTSLARYRIWDGIRGIDYLCSLPEVDPKRIGCVGNSGGGTLSAYISAIDPRVLVGIPSCSMTCLPRRMGNRIQRDPEADPEQDIFGIVSEGIDHAGLIALRVPRPTMLGLAIRDFFPIEGARETFDEVMHLYEVAGAAERFSKVEADAAHGLSLPIRQGAYAWFDKWLMRWKGDSREIEIKVESRPNQDILVCADGQVNVTFKSKPLPTLAVEEFRKQKKTPRVSLKDLLGMDPESSDFHLVKTEATGNPQMPHLVCINGVESAEWQTEAAFVAALGKAGAAVTIVDPRGVGKLRPQGLHEASPQLKGHSYQDPLNGVEENIAYNAFVLGKNLLGMRVADVLKAVARVKADANPNKIVLCGRRDGALVALFAAAVDPSIAGLAVEETPLSYWALFDVSGVAVNAASLVPRMLRDYGDIPQVVAALAPRKVLAAAATSKPNQPLANLEEADERFSADATVLLKWLKSL